MSTVRALTCVVFAMLVSGTPASAAGGPWPDAKGIQHLHFETAPVKVKPGQNTIDNYWIADSQKPKVDGFIVRARPDLVYSDGTVPPVDVIHLHHGVWLNASNTKAPAAPLFNVEPIFFGGEEKTVFRIPAGYGYKYKRTDTWILNLMIHNNTPNRTTVRVVWDLDFIPAASALARTVKPVVPLWMDVRHGWGYPVFDVGQGSGGSDGEFTFPDDEPASPYGDGKVQNEFAMPFGGTIVSAVGHLHPGGLRDDIDVVRRGALLPTAAACRQVALNAAATSTRRRCVAATAGSVPDSTRIFRSEAKYYDPAGPVSWDVSLTASRPDWRVLVRQGDVLRISTTYDSRASSWYENMGIVLLFVAPDDASGVDPFAAAVDWKGVLTHGHLAENDNHGGRRAIYPDPRKASDGPVTNSVDISNYQFRPGDLGLLYDQPRVPVVPRGQSLTFTNRDNRAYEWHSITTCAAPCNRATGISYPLANGAPGTQFDSGQLGFGPVGLSPAANRVTWQTPSTLPAGTYTYFCRIHSFMRGAFRVE